MKWFLRHLNSNFNLYFYLFCNIMWYWSARCVQFTAIVENKHEEYELQAAEKVVDDEKKSCVTSETDRWRIVRNRWCLAYTLLNNPSLSQYRKQNLSEKDEKAESVEEEKDSTEIANGKSDEAVLVKDMSVVPVWQASWTIKLVISHSS